MNIVHIPDDIKQEFHIDPDGKTFVTVNAAAQILGITRQGLQKNCNSNQISSKFGQYLSQSGIQLRNLSEKGISDVALAIIAKYYAYKAKSKSKQAEQFDLAMSAIGIRAWIQVELGYQQQHDRPIEEDLTRFETVADIMLTSKQINRLLKIGYAKRDGQFVDPKMLLGLSAKQLALPLQTLINMADKINEQIDRSASIRKAINQSKGIIGFGKAKKQGGSK